uniref:Uncharacterized protein n=1 Tax=Anguilla anguilla TaxID=7936 RepID=A0A0E9X035_ANGAN
MQSPEKNMHIVLTGTKGRAQLAPSTSQCCYMLNLLRKYSCLTSYRVLYPRFVFSFQQAFLSFGGGFTVGGLLNASRETTGRPGSHSLTTELPEFPFKGLGTQSLSNAQTGYRSPVQMGEEMPVLPPFCQPNSSNAL